MIHSETLGPVRRLRMTTWRYRLNAYDVSAWLFDGLLIDTGFGRVRAEFGAMLDALRPRGVIVTHGHEDHSGNAALVARRGIPMWITPETIAELDATHRMRFYRRFTWGYAESVSTPVVPFDPAPLEVIAAPGHAPDHQVVWDPERRLLFSGDLFLGVKVRIARAGERPRQHIASLRRIAALEPVTMFDAHRGPLDRAAELLAAKADWMDELVGAVERRVGRGEPDDVIARELLGKEPAERWVSFGDYSKERLVEAIRVETSN